MIDLHSHILPGVDDGARSLEEARSLARAAVADGVRAIAATPHVRHDYPTTAARMEEGVRELRGDLAREGIELEVLQGGEVSVDEIDNLSTDDLRRFTLGEGRRYLLLEFPDWGWPLALDGIIATLLHADLVPVLAHPERNVDVQGDPGRLAAPVSEGALVQVTASSLTGSGGRSARAAARRLLGQGLVHLLASDAHGSLIRRSSLGEAAGAVGDPRLARFLTVDVPAAIAAGQPLPSRPEARGFGARLAHKWR